MTEFSREALLPAVGLDRAGRERSPVIGILHGYLLEGSGSNLWTRSILEALCRRGERVHLVAQENHPERYPFIVEARRYRPDGTVETVHRGDSPYEGACVLHQPVLGDTLPVYVWDRYEEFRRVVPMVELTDAELADYLERNTAVVQQVVEENGVTVLHANHTVLMSVVAQRVRQATGVPYAVMPHGSALEYAVKRDVRYERLAESAFAEAGRIFVIGDELRTRLHAALPGVPDLEGKFSPLHLGVDTSQFEPVARAERPRQVARLCEALAGLRRGRTAAQGAQLRARLRPGLGVGEVAEASAAVQGYDTKAPDADLEEKLAAIDWTADPTLLFVGRLISNKGVHAVLAALPFILERHPSLRLLLVGHGPLREPLEAMLWALEHGEVALLESLVSHGRELEGSLEGEGDETPLAEWSHYLAALRERGELERYLEAARAYVRPHNVVFTGYLTHRELHFLFPCCDVAVFPSVVREAGPLVFLEALASGAYPLGTYFGGMAASIDAVAEVLPAAAAEVMKLSPSPERTVADIVRQVPRALALGGTHREALFRFARERYDWSSVARRLHDELEAL